VVALIVVAQDLADYIGPKSGLLLPVVRELAAEIASVWKNPQPGRMLRVQIDGRLVLLLDITSSIERARALVASL
jgi:hypothetical protein